MSTSRLVLVLALGWVGLGSASAETDWSVAATTWKQQLDALYAVDAARRLCGIETTKAERAMIGITIGGLEQALYGVRPASFDARTWRKEPVKAAGSRAKFCAPGSASLSAAKATLADIRQKILESQPQRIAAAAPVPALGPTPVVDPDISLIQNCRKAVIRLLGRRSTSNSLFWSKYEACVSDQGAGWF
jgi:hypothetical protein